ncbi:MAG: zinc-ribbon domain-containing protein [Candidatus Aenigmatarchaeota archaeon]
MSGKLKASWLFLIGVVVIIVGFFLFFLEYLNQQYSFIIMLVGLLISGVGSVYGRKKIMGSGFEPKPEKHDEKPVETEEDIKELLKGIDSPRKVKPIQNLSQSQPPQQVTQQVVSQPRAANQEQSGSDIQQILNQHIQEYEKKKPEKPIQEEPEPQQIVHPYPYAQQQYSSTGYNQQQRVIKVYICPKCGVENDQKNIFCYKCGKKIQMGGGSRRKTS